MDSRQGGDGVKVDFHFHLEEGPYSTGWLQRTAQAIANVNVQRNGKSEDVNTIQWIERITDQLVLRLKQGSFSKEWLSHYLSLGKDRGVQHFGIVDHLYRFKEFRSYYEKHIILDDSKLGRMQRYWLDRVCMGSIEDFIALVRGAQEEGAPISLGVEADYFPGGEEELRALLSQYEFDYVIGSVHYLDGWGFDNPEAEYLFREKELVSLYRQLFDTVKGAIESGLFHLIAHLDNLKVFNHRPDEQLLLPMYEDVAKALKAADLATEINTGLAYRYPVKEMCPSPTFLQILYAHGVPISLSSDSHFPDDIATMLDDAVGLAKKTGYKQIVYYKERQRYILSLED
jgi:histidinol-phosphatase (PHP family)